MTTLAEASKTLGYTHPIKFAIAIRRATGHGMVGAPALPPVGGPEQEMEPTFLAVALDFIKEPAS
jgi:hypothetical protein